MSEQIAERDAMRERVAKAILDAVQDGCDMNPAEALIAADAAIAALKDNIATDTQVTPSVMRRAIKADVGDLVPHGLRKNAVNALLEAGCSAAMVSSITGQSMQIVEQYALKRNNRKLAKTAMGKWDAK